MPKSPVWFKAGISKVLSRSISRPDALLAFIQGVLLPNEVKMSFDSILKCAQIVSRNPIGPTAGQHLTDPYWSGLRLNLIQVINNDGWISNENVNLFVAALLSRWVVVLYVSVDVAI